MVSIIHQNCCGLDIHKKIISACLIKTDENGKEEVEIKEFGTFTKDLMQLRLWLLENKCPIAAMESTGVYWRPVHNILEGYMEVILVNARHIKNVPGRKTDVEDSKWLAGLLKYGLVRGSFIPAKEIRQWKELNTLRRKYTETLGDYKRRVHKLFETANIKIDSVVSDLFGKTGRNLMNLLADENGELSIENIEKATKGTLKAKLPELQESITGFFEAHHRYQLNTILKTIKMLEDTIADITNRLTILTAQYDDVLKRLDEIPGINTVSAQAIISHIGITLDEFPSAAALASWAGLCPGNNESAGKRKTGRIRVPKHPLKTILIEVAWPAVKKKDSYYKDKFYKLKSRIGPKKAITAIAHKIIKVVFHVIKFGKSFKDLGSQFLADLNISKKLASLQFQAKQFGFQLIPSNT